MPDVLVAGGGPTGLLTRDGTEPRLVRPDGYVAWAGGPGLGLDLALRRWFGPPVHAVAG
jgi:hypothetical protein